MLLEISYPCLSLYVVFAVEPLPFKGLGSDTACFCQGGRAGDGRVRIDLTSHVLTFEHK